MDYTAEIEEGLVTRYAHPSLPLFGYNYADKCSWERAWNAKTVQARGLVLDDQGEYVSRPMPKFFNLGEVEGSMGLPVGPCMVQDKIDGSCAIVSNTAKYGLLVNTRGSFVSEQAVWARKAIEDSGWDPSPHYTYCFEVVYANNRIVVDYGGYEGLFLLAVIVTDTGEELHPQHPDVLTPFPTAKSYGQLDMSNAKEFAVSEAFAALEGVVCVWYLPDGTAFRVKVKHPAYVAAHRLVSHLTDHGVWDCMRQGISVLDAVEGIADELYDEVRAVETKFRARSENIYASAAGLVDALLPDLSRKEAAAVINASIINKSVAFALLDRDEQKAWTAVWRALEPHPKTAIFSHGSAL